MEVEEGNVHEYCCRFLGRNNHLYLKRPTNRFRGRDYLSGPPLSRVDSHTTERRVTFDSGITLPVFLSSPTTSDYRNGRTGVDWTGNFNTTLGPFTGYTGIHLIPTFLQRLPVHPLSTFSSKPPPGRDKRESFGT